MESYQKNSATGSAETETALSDEEGFSLWRRLAETVKLLPGRKLPPKKAQKAELAKATPSPKKQANPKIQPKAKPPKPSPADLAKGENHGMNRRDADRFRRGKFTIQARLDLHGLSKGEAYDRLHSFILSARRQEYRYVLVITGKGREGQGILRQQVPAWLKEPKLGPYVNAFVTAQPRDGGEGAIYVRLRRERGKIK